MGLVLRNITETVNSRAAPTGSVLLHGRFQRFERSNNTETEKKPLITPDR